MNRKLITRLCVLVIVFLGCALCAHPVPHGWSDDIDAVVAKAKAEKKNIFVYFPLGYDRCGRNGNMFSPIKANTNPKVTVAMSKDFVLAFNSGNRIQNKNWRKLNEYAKGATPAYMIVSPDLELMWLGLGMIMTGFDDTSTWKPADFEEKLSLGFVRDIVPKFKLILPKLQKARKRCKNVTDEREKAKIMYEVFRSVDRKIVTKYFCEECSEMVKADKDGTLGIREMYPYYWIVIPLFECEWKFCDAREVRIRELCKQDNTLSREAAGKIAVMDMKDEWMPKMRKLLKVAKKAENKLTDEEDLRNVKNLENVVEGYIRFWNGQTNTLSVLK